VGEGGKGGSTLVMSSVRSEAVKGWIVRVGGRVVRGVSLSAFSFLFFLGGGLFLGWVELFLSSFLLLVAWMERGG